MHARVRKCLKKKNIAINTKRFDTTIFMFTNKKHKRKKPKDPFEKTSELIQQKWIKKRKLKIRVTMKKRYNYTKT